VAQLVAALIIVHGLLSFLSDVYGLLDPSGETLWLSVDHRRLRPVDDESHVINWSQATVIDREPERFARWIKEAIHIRKEGQQAMNRNDGSYQLSHAYVRFLDTASSRRVKNRKN